MICKAKLKDKINILILSYLKLTKYKQLIPSDIKQTFLYYTDGMLKI